MNYNGIINVYKESGYTSHDVVAKMRGILKQKKIGHTGTLDPQAQGVLPVCLGTATKVSDLLTEETKEYRAVLLLGISTDTQDTGGTICRQRPVTCSEEEVLACISRFTGEQMQIPPMYSALKVNGKKLCDLARRGIEVERKARKIVIEEIRAENLCLPEATLRVVCSRGTYIRTLCSDIGDALGCGGCMKSLLRTRVGPFTVEKSVSLKEIEQYQSQQQLEKILHPTDMLFAHYPAVYLSDAALRLVQNGNPLSPALLEGQENPENLRGPLLRIYSPAGVFLALYQWNMQKERYCAVKMFLF